MNKNADQLNKPNCVSAFSRLYCHAAPHAMPKYTSIFLISFGVAFFAGCSDEVTVRVVDQATTRPVVGALVHRDRPSSGLEKITNPIGTTYHPMTTAESRWTDTTGSCVITGPKQTDVLRIFVATGAPLTVMIGDRTLSLSPGTNATSSLVYSVWQDAGSPKVLAEQPSWDWQKERR